MATIFRNLSDEDLLNQITIKQDQEAFSVLYQRYLHLALGMCLKYLNLEESKDAVQNVFLQIWQNCSHYNIQKFKPWFIQVLKNHCLQILRKQGMQEVPVELTEKEISVTDEISYSQIKEEKLLVYLNLCLKSLNKDQQDSIIHFYINEKSYQETAESAGLTYHQVKSYLQNGRRNLKICLQKKMKEY